MASPDAIQQSAVSERILRAGAETSTQALPLEVIHNLQHQHGWTDLRLHSIVPTTNPSLIEITVPASSSSPSSISSPGSEYVYLISGVPPRQVYTHPDFLNHSIKHGLKESDLVIQTEWVLPLINGEKWTLERFCHIFDHLPTRPRQRGALGFEHQDTKRVLCGIKARDGMGGDGTIVYYIMQEGEVKPRQN